MGEGVCPSGSNATTERGKKTTCGRVKATQSQRGKGFDHLQRKSNAKESASISRDNLKCFYINARSIVNKIDQFEVWIHELNPDIIGITESWAGSHILDSELAIEGYDLFRKDRSVDRMGGGVLLYVRSTLCPVQCELQSAFPEQVCCYISDSNGYRFYIGVCYRSPTVNVYGNGNHELLRDIINELSASKRHFVMMGDFNYRYREWPPTLNDHTITADALQFFNCLEDNFFTQHVNFCTRNDAVLDLVNCNRKLLT